MATEKAVDFLVEYDGTGAPTGNAWMDGVKFTGITEAMVGRLPPSDGKTTTKITSFQSAVYDVSTPGTFTVTSYKHGKHGDKGQATNLTKA